MNKNTVNTTATQKTAEQKKAEQKQKADNTALFNFKKAQLKAYGVTAESKLTAEQKKEFTAKVLTFKANLQKTAEQKTDSKKAKEQKTDSKAKQKTEKADAFNKKAELKKLEAELKKKLAGAELSTTEAKAKILVKKSGKSVFKCFVQKAGIRVYTDETTAKKAKLKAEKKSDSYQFAYTCIATLEQIEKLYAVAEVKQKTDSKKQKQEGK